MTTVYLVQGGKAREPGDPGLTDLGRQQYPALRRNHGKQPQRGGNRLSRAPDRLTCRSAGQAQPAREADLSSLGLDPTPCTACGSVPS
jgi:hypothetical protein